MNTLVGESEGSIHILNPWNGLACFVNVINNRNIDIFTFSFHSRTGELLKMQAGIDLFFETFPVHLRQSPQC